MKATIILLLLTALLPGARLSHAASKKTPAPGRLVRKIPLSTFKSTEGLKPGAVIEALADGKKFTGTIIAMGKKDVTIEVNPESLSRKTLRKVPLGMLKSKEGLKVGSRIEAATAGGDKFTGTVTEIGKEELTIEVENL